MHLSWTKFFWYKLLLLLSSSYWPFSLCKIKKNCYKGSRVMRMHHFWAQNGTICLTQIFFFLKIINIILIYQLVPFIVQNFKKILPADPELWKLAIFGPKMAHFPKWHLKKKQPVNEPCFFHSCLSIFHKWKSDINLLLKYWWLKNTEISLAESHFWL